MVFAGVRRRSQVFAGVNRHPPHTAYVLPFHFFTLSVCSGSSITRLLDYSISHLFSSLFLSVPLYSLSCVPVSPGGSFSFLVFYRVINHVYKEEYQESMESWAQCLLAKETDPDVCGATPGTRPSLALTWAISFSVGGIGFTVFMIYGIMKGVLH